MKNDTVHGIERNDGVGVIFHGCGCGDCDNVIMEAADSEGGSVSLTMNPGSFRRLLGEMMALAEHVAFGNDSSPDLDGKTVGKHEGSRFKGNRKRS